MQRHQQALEIATALAQKHGLHLLIRTDAERGNYVHVTNDKVPTADEGFSIYEAYGPQDQILASAIDAIEKYIHPARFANTENFIAAFQNMQMDVHKIAVDKGWWNADRNDGEMIALMHSELSEALEALRHGNPASDHIPNFTGLEEELADVVIRVMDMAAKRGLRLPEAIIAKAEFNANRPHKHGGKAF